jgi:transposase-like protein
MVKTGAKLGSKKEAAILAMLTTRSIEEAARLAGVPPRTLYRWLKEHEFDAAYRKAKRTAFGQATARLHQGAGAAATTMMKIMLDAGASASTRLRAADCVFSHGRNAFEMEEIEARISALEQAAEDAKDHER